MMRGIMLLGLAYVLSQFFRAFLAVLSPFLRADIGANPEDLAFASGLWFFAFAAMQLPVGWALDTIAERLPSCCLSAAAAARHCSRWPPNRCISTLRWSSSELAVLRC